MTRPRAGSKYLQGKFRPNNWQKYKGDSTNIFYRSSWELKLMIWLDNNPAILEWSSEELAIPYVSPKDGQVHRYFVDAVVKMKTKEGIKTFIIEVKPEAQIQPPKKPKKITKRYIEQVMTYAVNQAKWERAREYAKKREWGFATLNEYDLGIKKRPQ